MINNLSLDFITLKSSEICAIIFHKNIKIANKSIVINDNNL
jgi:hypothetical protein